MWVINHTHRSKPFSVSGKWEGRWQSGNGQRSSHKQLEAGDLAPHPVDPVALLCVKPPGGSLGEDNHGVSGRDGAWESSAHPPKLNSDRNEFEKSLLGLKRKRGEEELRM